ncbi:MAG: rhodanese-like domain-containing protein [candidate division KSB1 bacterium]|nr:rhodanese-like domain-containing protein [candidate division KSB1 bacterium]
MLMRILQGTLAAIFLLSAIGKGLHPTDTAMDLAGLFLLPAGLARAAVYALILFELTVAILILVRRYLGLILWIPVFFFAVFLYSLWQNQSCSCFGELPLLRALPATGHGLLLAGMFLGLYCLQRDASVTNRRSDRPRPAILAGFALILLAAALLTIPLAGSNPEVRPSSLDTVTLDDVWQAIDTGSAVLIDARSPFQYDIGHIPGAINIPVDAENLPALYENHDLRDRELIIYCAGPHCDAAERLAARLRELGHRRVRVFSGGWEAWSAQE